MGNPEIFGTKTVKKVFNPFEGIPLRKNLPSVFPKGIRDFGRHLSGADRVVCRRTRERSTWNFWCVWAHRGSTVECQCLDCMRCRRNEPSDREFLVQTNACQELFRENDSRAIAQLNTSRCDTGYDSLRHRQRCHVIDAGGRLGCGNGHSQGQAGESELFQCRKCLMPVNTMAIPAASAASITSWSRMEPPG